ncbi:phosphatase PAP2 family protein [Streptomyces sp. H10-C2]|uniref:phosphatase PAP2 family protein n=1 Tax=unclassified Streptomyces TaxID=2593676 RepID=UPI0024BA97B6|nr:MULTISPECIES: phosphatase PAP2 family protein [unclassified Streptomyces]MDJ0343649.1 phosphatase PAP2 family protein [Streptomyces sp. PH10-H1]MDJ0373103.1 phosphatase PAP2 family protein [Streptomyces sp. H10-C2]
MNEPALPERRAGLVPLLGVSALCAALFVLLAVWVIRRDGAPFAVDLSLHVWSVKHRPSGAVSFARAVTATGTGVFPYLCALTAGLIAGRDARQRLWAAAGALGFLGLTQVARLGLLHAIGRPRPAIADWATHASGFAFPSGHATTSAFVAGLLAWAVARRVRTAAAVTGCVVLTLWAVSVGLSRIYLGVHWASDVLGGWFFALTWLGLGAAVIPVTRLLPRR